MCSLLPLYLRVLLPSLVYICVCEKGGRQTEGDRLRGQYTGYLAGFSLSGNCQGVFQGALRAWQEDDRERDRPYLRPTAIEMECKGNGPANHEPHLLMHLTKSLTNQAKCGRISIQSGEGRTAAPRFLHGSPAK